MFIMYGWPFLSIPRTLTATSNFERFHFDLVYFENLERRIKCNLINPFRERLLRNSTSNPYGDFELRSSRFRLQLYAHVYQYNCMLMYTSTTVYSCIPVQLYAHVYQYNCMLMYTSTTVYSCIPVQLYTHVYQYNCILMYTSTTVYSCIPVQLYAHVYQYNCMCMYTSTTVCSSIPVQLYAHVDQYNCMLNYIPLINYHFNRLLHGKIERFTFPEDC